MNENMILNLGGSGGAPLNFKVVGNPQPASPKENTIWVDTDAEITGWQFASDDPNLLDFNNWANNVEIWYGTKAVSGNSITLTANERDCHTGWQGESGIVPIPCVAGRTYILEWEHSGADGLVYLFPSGQADNLVMTSAYNRKLELTPADGVTFFTFRVGVMEANSTATYSNIRITEKERAFKPGSVWIQTGITSTVAMNVLKKNSIQVYPISANQYVNGAWVAKNARTYQGGAWVDWIHPDIAKIYNLKEVRENGTGGATVTIGKEMVLTTTSAGSAQGYVAFYSAEKIDLTNYSKLTFKGSRSPFGQSFMVGFRTANTRYWNWGEYADDIAASVRVEPTEATYSVDVSSLNGSYYFFANFAGQSSAGTATMNLSNFELT